MTRRLESFFILSFVSDWIEIFVPAPFDPVKPRDFNVLTQLKKGDETQARKEVNYMSVSVWRDQQ
jgi:hypothetical protein